MTEDLTPPAAAPTTPASAVTAPASGADDAAPARGPLFAVGGAEDKLGRRQILTAFCAAAGGDAARIVVIPTASSLGPEIGEVYQAVFRRMGARSVRIVRPTTREQAHDADDVAAVAAATGIFMTGGNQMKLSSVLVGTPIGEAIVTAHAGGAVVGGTSAGCSILAEHMIAFGRGAATPRTRMSTLSVGLGLIRGVILDQHFDQRNRYGRLLSLVSLSPATLGLGVDEDTAAVIRPDGTLEVIGRGAVTIFDATHAHTTAYQTESYEPIMVSGVQLHVLPHGAQFDLGTRRLIRDAEPRQALDVAETKIVEAELRHLVRRINNEDGDSAVGPEDHRRDVHRALHRHLVTDLDVQQRLRRLVERDH